MRRDLQNTEVFESTKIIPVDAGEVISIQFPAREKNKKY